MDIDFHIDFARDTDNWHGIDNKTDSDIDMDTITDINTDSNIHIGILTDIWQ